MRRNKAALVNRAIERAALQAAEGTALAGARPGADGMAAAGEDVSGTWSPYGLLDITLLDSFLLGRGRPPYGQLDVTALGEFILAPGGRS